MYGSTVDDLTASLFFRSTEEKAFEKIYEFSLKDGQGGFSIVGPADDPDKLLIMTNLETDKIVLAEFDLVSRKIDDIIFEDRPL